MEIMTLFVFLLLDAVTNAPAWSKPLLAKESSDRKSPDAMKVTEASAQESSLLSGTELDKG